MAAEATPPDIGLSLALAVVASSTAPILLLDGAFSVLAASTTFSTAFQLDAERVVGRPVFALGLGEWNGRRLHSLLEAVASGDADVPAYEMDLVRRDVADRKLVLGARKLQYGDPAHPRILLTITDVTDARESERIKEELLREKTILLQEVQHRVANSLQIIASVLMQSARQVQSEETRGHLRDAHNRVMSIAAVQQQLAASRVGQVEIAPYFRQLCKSLSASMIFDPNEVGIHVEADESRVEGNTSVSLGLVVTELVINALKHAFPDHRVGAIVVSYVSAGKDWTLKVKDDGVGIKVDPANAGAGLGTNIVEALARHLRADISVEDRAPGTEVTLAHKSGGSQDERGAPAAV